MNAINDIQLQWQLDGADIVLKNADIALDDSLGTAVIVSLFTDRRALDSDVLPSGTGTDKRGWWGDSFNERPIGSRLWLLGREKQLSTVLHRAKSYAEEALAWLLDEKLVKTLTVTASVPEDGWLLLSISLTLPDGSVLPMPFKTRLNGV